MQNFLERYQNMTVNDLVFDDDFSDWVLGLPSMNEIDFEALKAMNYSLKEKMDEARKTILLMKEPIPVIDEEIKNRVWEKVEANAASSGKIVNLRQWPKRLAAACVMFLCLSAAYYFYTQKTTPKPAELVHNNPMTVKDDAAPGGNRAILTLANGQTVLLDSVDNGSIGHQGGVKILKLDDGQIAYQSHGITNSQEAIQYNTISTPRGGQYQLVLQDGSKVWLNAASRIKFPAAFVGDTRDVEIEGEAYFEIAHNASKPFTVKTKSVDVQVLGTHFNIKAYADESSVKTTLLEGSVKVSTATESKTIKPGQQASVPENSDNISIAQNVDVEGVVAWKNGYFYFENTELQDIMRQLSRWYDVEVVYDGKVPTGRYVGKPSRNLNLSQILKVIEYSGVKMKIKGNKIIVDE